MTVNEIYEKIGQEVINAIDDNNWKNATLNIEVVGDGVVGYTGDYIDNNTQVDIDVGIIDDNISDWIQELHEITTKGGNNKWNKAIFSITFKGKFDMKFIWDQSLDDEIRRLSK